MNDTTSIISTLLDLSRKLLKSIDEGDYEAYSSLCASTLSSFEPETQGVLVEGLEFHKFYFDNNKKKINVKSNITNEKVRLLSNNTCAVISYLRIIQSFDGERFQMKNFSETRVWEFIEKENKWIHVHFHRSEMK